MNEAFADLLGYTKEELLGLTFLDVTHPEDIDIDRDLSDQVFAGTLPHFTVRKRYIRKDGSLLVGDLTATLSSTRSKDGPIGVAVLRDATNRSPIGKQLQSLQREATLGQLTPALVHDLRNDLQAITGALDLLALSHPDDAVIESATAAAEHANDLVSALLGYARDGQPSTSDLGTVLTDAAAVFELALSSNITFSMQPAGEDIAVDVGPQELVQVLLNLLSNARDALDDEPNGRISLTAETRQTDHARCVHITISDNGPGIADPDPDRVFDPAFSTKGEEGNGLGLTIAQDIVQRAGGTLKIVETGPQGTTLEIELPEHVGTTR